ncbi:MAG: lysophospholipid acyltransferase family protein [Elusimicrobiaceae bacterium]|nr:lysophospholipid acyltransferase family protein [Elusimicrobiaceae bacterium]
MIRLGGRLVLGGLYRLKTDGLENIPQTGSVIIACNHFSDADPVALDITVLRVRPPRFVAKKELFSVPLLGRALRQVRAIPVDRYNPDGDLNALRSTINGLAKGDCMIIFPQGTRSKNGRIAEPKSGVGFIACRSGAQVVPARIRGTERFPHPARLSLMFGEPYSWNRFTQETRITDKKESYKEFSRKLMEKIEKL